MSNKRNNVFFYYDTIRINGPQWSPTVKATVSDEGEPTIIRVILQTEAFARVE